jgi:4-methylaminobutanoate oxidase (formaldehyde-forming)
MGPNAEALLRKLSPDDVSKAAMPLSTTRDIDVGYARVRAARMSYVGGPGYELYVPVEQCLTLYDALWTEGAALGLMDAGYYTIDALRIEAGRRAWGAELSPDESPWQAGLGFAVKLDKRDGFVGREALLKARDEPLLKRLLAFAFEDPQAFPWGGEPILMDGASVGELTSAGYSREQGRALALGYARMPRPVTADRLQTARFEVDIAGERTPASARLA